MSDALGKGELDLKTRGRLALTVAENNGCGHCLSAHTYIGKNMLQLDDAELSANRDASSGDPKAQAALRFAAQVVRARGHVSDGDLAAVQAAGYSQAQVLEIVMGQPYLQHRGGPRGFLKVLGPRTLAFADVAGNRQYISVGNLADNPKVHLFLMDYANRQRVKVWGTAKVVEDDAALLEKLVMPDGGKAERAIVIDVVAWDANCPQHIPVLLEAEDVKALLDAKDRRIAELEAKLLSSSRRSAAPPRREPG